MLLRCVKFKLSSVAVPTVFDRVKRLADDRRSIMLAVRLRPTEGVVDCQETSVRERARACTRAHRVGLTKGLVSIRDPLCALGLLDDPIEHLPSRAQLRHDLQVHRVLEHIHDYGALRGPCAYEYECLYAYAHATRSCA